MRQPYDQRGAPYPVLCPKSTTKATLAANTMATIPVTSGIEVVRIYTTALCYVAVGQDATSSSMPIAASGSVEVAMGGSTYVTAICTTGTPQVFVTEMG